MKEIHTNPCFFSLRKSTSQNKPQHDPLKTLIKSSRLEDHRRTCKQVVYAPFIRHEVRLFGGVPQPQVLGTYFITMVMITAYIHADDPLSTPPLENPSPGWNFQILDGAFIQQIGQISTWHSRRLPCNGCEIHTRSQILVLGHRSKVPKHSMTWWYIYLHEFRWFLWFSCR